MGLNKKVYKLLSKDQIKELRPENVFNCMERLNSKAKEG